LKKTLARVDSRLGRRHKETVKFSLEKKLF